MGEIREIAKILSQMSSEDDIFNFLKEILSESELSDLSKRWRILIMLSEGRTQRDIANELSVSLCKVTRGSKILKEQDAVVKEMINGVRNEKEKDS